MSLQTELIDWIDAASLAGIAKRNDTAQTGILFERLPADDTDAIAIQIRDPEADASGFSDRYMALIDIRSQGDTVTKHETVIKQIWTRNETESVFRPIVLTTYTIEQVDWLTPRPARIEVTASGLHVYRSACRARIKEN